MEERRKENIKKRRRKLNWAPDYTFGPTITKTRTRAIPAVALTCGPSPSATPSRAPAFLHVPPFHLHVGPPSQSLLAREQILTGGPACPVPRSSCVPRVSLLHGPHASGSFLSPIHATQQTRPIPARSQPSAIMAGTLRQVCCWEREDKAGPVDAFPYFSTERLAQLPRRSLPHDAAVHVGGRFRGSQPSAALRARSELHVIKLRRLTVEEVSGSSLRRCNFLPSTYAPPQIRLHRGRGIPRRQAW
jgi:hypothetical protein